MLASKDVDDLNFRNLMILVCSIYNTSMKNDTRAV